MEFGKQEKYKKVDEVLGRKGLIMLSTSSKEGALHVCIMHYVRTNTRALLLSCDEKSTKIRNIGENPGVGLVKFHTIKRPSLLIYGKAKIVRQDDEIEECRRMFRVSYMLQKLIGKDRRFIHVDIQKVIYEWYPPGGTLVYFEVEPY